MTTETPPPLAPAKPSKGLSVGVILARVLGPPIILGAGFALSMLAQAEAWQIPVVVLAVVGMLACFANTVHVSVQIVTAPEKAPLDLPRVASGILLFIGVSVVQTVLFMTAAFGGCACLNQLGLRSGMFF